MWNKLKLYMILDLQRVNEKLILNAYLLLQQNNVLSAMGGVIVFSSLDIIKGFF